jgi:hypothetical protein
MDGLGLAKVLEELPKFSRTKTAASRNRLLRFLAPLVATWDDYREGQEEVAVFPPFRG